MLRSAALSSPVLVMVAAFFALAAVHARAADDAQAARDKLVVEAVKRLEGFDLDSSEKAKGAVLRYLGRNRGSEDYFELIDRFQIEEMADDLVKIAAEGSGETAGVEAARLLLKMKDAAWLNEQLSKEKAGPALASAIGNVGSREAVSLLVPLLAEKKKHSLQLRTAAAAAVGQNVLGQRALLELVKAGELPPDLEFTAANALHGSSLPAIRDEAKKYLKLPETAGADPLPPIAELIARRGDAARGRKLFFGRATCAKCHKVRGEGKEVGPDLSEIGSKLTREAMYVAILNPSAGISHNYENYAVATLAGNVFTGLLVSQTDDTITIKTAEGVARTFKTDEVEEVIKLRRSLMPEGLQKLITVEELVDVVEFMVGLKKNQ